MLPKPARVAYESQAMQVSKVKSRASMTVNTYWHRFMAFFVFGPPVVFMPPGSRDLVLFSHETIGSSQSHAPIIRCRLIVIFFPPNILDSLIRCGSRHHGILSHHAPESCSRC
jgi:hypothetical protein